MTDIVPNGDKNWSPKPHDYYPFENMGWDHGKRATRQIRDELPAWTEHATLGWMFSSLGYVREMDAVVAYKTENGGNEIVFKVKEGLPEHYVLNHMSRLLRSCATSHEQKVGTVQYFMNEWCELVHEKPRRII